MIFVNIEKAKSLAHDMRRSARDADFRPHDEVIAKQIPGVDIAQEEAARAAIREKYALMQQQIDAADSAEGIKAALGL